MKSRNSKGLFFKQQTSLTLDNQEEIIKKSKTDDDTETSKPKDDSKQKYLRMILIIVFGLIFLFSAYKVVTLLLEQKDGIDYNEDLQNAVSVSTDEVNDENTEEENIPQDEDETVKEESKKTEYADGSKVNIDFNSLLAKNGDVKAWIYLEGTNINYPIAQGKDNEQYLHTLLNGKTNAAGTMFIDSANKDDFSDIVTVIYGHNMHNGTMLHALLNYKQQSFYNEHPYLYIYTPTQKYRLYIYGGCVTTDDSDVYDLPRNYDYLDSYLDIFKRNAMFKSNTTIEKGDKLVLLSTCAYDIKNGRFVILGKLVPFD